MTDELEAHRRGKVNVAAEVAKGVNISTLTAVFGLNNNQQTQNKLRKVAPIGEYVRGTQTHPLYDLAEAAKYLVKPEVDVEDILKRVRPEDLPPRLMPAYWDAQNKRLNYEERSGELWRTEKVRSVLGTMFQTIKFTMQLWAEQIERVHGLTKEQRDTLLVLVDQLQDDIYKNLAENAKIERTLPEIADMEKMVERASGNKVGEEDDDYI